MAWGHKLLWPVAAVAVTAAAVASGCAVRGEPVLAAEVAAATSTPLPTAMPFPISTPTPSVTAAPVERTRRRLDRAFAALDELGLDYTFAAKVGGDMVQTRRIDAQLIPASNQKLLTALGVLELLPLDFRFETEVRLGSDATLYVIGGGDPTLTAHDFSTIADRLAASGVLRRVGDVVVDASRYPFTRSGPGWPARYIPWDTGPMSAFMIDDNRHRSDQAYLDDPELGNAALLVELLEEAGISVDGRPRSGRADRDAPIIATGQSPSLLAMVELVLGTSDNQVADGLVREIGLRESGTGEISSGLEVIYGRLEAMGIDLPQPSGDGSGLSRNNRLSARQILDLLSLSSEHRHWPVMEAGLAGAAEGATLIRRLDVDPFERKIRAKTGTLMDARALSGVLETVDGQDVIFSFLVNGDAVADAGDAMAKVISALANTTAEELAEL